MHSEKIPLLLTSSVIPSDKTVKLNQPELRLKHTLESINHWKKHTQKIKLIICDGSNYDLSKIINNQFPQLAIGCLHFKNNAQMIVDRGKGYGEGEIIKFALNNSQFQKEYNIFLNALVNYGLKIFKRLYSNLALIF